MNQDNHETQAENTERRMFARLAIGGLLALIVMTVCFSFVGPSGQRFDVGSFVLFWLREILAVLLCLMVVGVSVYEKLTQPRRASAKPPIRAESNGRAWE